MPIVLASDDADRRGRIADALVRSGAPLATVSTWEGLVRELALPGATLVLVDGELNELRPRLLHELCESLDIVVLAFGQDAAPLPRLQLQRLPVLVKRHAAPAMAQDDRKELRLLGLGRDTQATLAAHASADNPVVLHGERGTGKKRIARALHRLSGRSGPLLVCTGDPPPLEGEPGTVYLTGLDLNLRDTITRWEERCRETGWRLVAGTRRRPGPALRRWSQLELRPLRLRQDELRDLTRLYIHRTCRGLGQPRRRFDRRLWAMIRAYRWPGNTLELETFVIQALAATRGPVVVANALPAHVRALVQPRADGRLLEQTEGFEEVVEGRLQGIVDALDPAAPVALHRLVVQASERALLRIVLGRTGGNQKAAAQMLGLARNTLRTKAIAYGLIDPARR